MGVTAGHLFGKDLRKHSEEYGSKTGERKEPLEDHFEACYHHDCPLPHQAFGARSCRAALEVGVERKLWSVRVFVLQPGHPLTGGYWGLRGLALLAYEREAKVGPRPREGPQANRCWCWHLEASQAYSLKKRYHWGTNSLSCATHSLVWPFFSFLLLFLFFI